MEKNLTVSSLNMITTALDITLEEFFLLSNPLKIEEVLTLKIMKHYLIKISLDYFKKLMQITKKLLEIFEKLIEWKEL